ncbi:MAG: hypothetical protein QW505_04690 [Thermoplasmata archaeon]
MTLSLFGKRQKEVSTVDARQPPRWKVATFSQADEDNRHRKKTAFSFWSATKYVMILSLLLWWLPVFGQMIAGYVGGRKAGSPWRGVAAAILPVIAIFSVMTAIDYLFPSYAVGTGSASASLLTGIVSAVPFVGPYLDFTREYVSQFIASLQGASPYQMNSYLLTIAFAYVGGILADQARREIDAVSGRTGHQTTVMVAPGLLDEGMYPSASRSFFHPGAYAHSNWGLLPHFSLRRRPVVQSYSQLVPEDVELEDDEKPVSKKKALRRKLANGGSTSLEHHRSKHVHERKAEIKRPKPVLRVSTRNPRTLIKAEKMIEREWNPKLKNKKSPWFARKEQVARPAVGKTKARMKNWESF